MYRQYENPWELEDQLAELGAAIIEARYEGVDESALIDMEIAFAEMKDRVNHAWADEEYDSYY